MSHTVLLLILTAKGILFRVIKIVLDRDTIIFRVTIEVPQVTIVSAVIKDGKDLRFGTCSKLTSFAFYIDE
jgi:hypothetical protein